MLTANNNSKEAIKTRMLRIALNYWSIKNADELDPLVKLLMDALAAELHDLVNEINNSESRIVEKMAELMVPDLLTSPSPAHAVIHAMPAEAKETLSQYDQFYVEKKIASKYDGPLDTSVDLFFAPVNNPVIVNAQVQYILSGDGLYQYDKFGNKLMVATAAKSTAQETCVWLGVKVNANVTNLAGMRFFFDFKNIDYNTTDVVFQSLPFTRWFVDDTLVKGSVGEVAESVHQLNEVPGNQLIQSVKLNINTAYNNKFYTLLDQTLNVDEIVANYPAAFTNLFAPAALDKIDTPVVWFKVVFPVSIPNELMAEMQVTLNAFAVMNARLNELQYRLRPGRNIIPIPNVFKERFLSIQSLTDGLRPYRSLPFKSTDEEEVGTYTLRTGGLERFDSRSGKEMINYLLQLIRSESAAFSALGHDFIASTLKELNKYIALLEQKTNASVDSSFEIPSYILVKPIDENDVLYLEYWTTNAELSNNLRSGTRVQQSSGVSLQADSLYLLTPTMGGKDKLKTEEKLYAFKYGLTSRDRIVTKEDIRNFCFFELGKKLHEVNIKRGVEMSHNPKEGLRKTIDIILTPTSEANNGEWQLLCDQLRLKLKAHSAMSTNYRVLS